MNWGKGGERGKVEGKEGKGRGAIILLSRFPLSGFRSRRCVTSSRSAKYGPVTSAQLSFRVNRGK